MIVKRAVGDDDDDDSGMDQPVSREKCWIKGGRLGCNVWCILYVWCMCACDTNEKQDANKAKGEKEPTPSRVPSCGPLLAEIVIFSSVS